MKKEALNREIEKTKNTLENPQLKFNERYGLEQYLISLKKENAE